MVVRVVEQARTQTLRRQATGDGRKSCVNYGKRHKLPDNKCSALDANKEDRPENCVKNPPGFNNSGN